MRHSCGFQLLPLGMVWIHQGKQLQLGRLPSSRFIGWTVVLWRGAAGIHTDSVTDAGIYYRLDRAQIALPGLDLYCGGTSEYICSWP